MIIMYDLFKVDKRSLLGSKKGTYTYFKKRNLIKGVYHFRWVTGNYPEKYSTNSEAFKRHRISWAISILLII